MKEKKLLIFMPSVQDGGVEKNFFLIVNYLSKKFSNVTIITAHKSIRKKLNKNISLIAPDSNFWITNSRYPKYFICLIYLTLFLLRNKFTLVFAFQANGYASIISKIFKTTIITRSNSSSDGWSKNILKVFLYKFLLKLPDEVIVNSYEFKKELDNKFNISTTVIYNPLNKKEIIKKSKRKLNLKFFQKKDLKLITVGRLVDQKDQITLLKAINLIKEKLNFKLLLIGRGNEETKLKIFIDKNKITKFVKIIPFQKNPYKFIIKADLFILTSKFEGLPNVLLEAQSLKKYIISTNCPTGPKEILLNGRLGDLVKVQDYKKLASKILIFNKEKHKKSTYNKINFSFKKLSRFDYISNMKKYEKVLQKYIYV
tara:strand:- start:173 stop:1282 length:1110 start_codon:yes stop_codon:yes gene_type:complete